MTTGIDASGCLKEVIAIARGDRVCFVDGTPYHYCPGCGGNPEETWRFLYCSTNCMMIEKLWEQYFRDHLISKEDALVKVEELDTSKVAMYREQIRHDMVALIKEAEVNKTAEDVPESTEAVSISRAVKKVLSKNEAIAARNRSKLLKDSE